MNYTSMTLTSTHASMNIQVEVGNTSTELLFRSVAQEESDELWEASGVDLRKVPWRVVVSMADMDSERPPDDAVGHVTYVVGPHLKPSCRLNVQAPPTQFDHLRSAILTRASLTIDFLASGAVKADENSDEHIWNVEKTPQLLIEEVSFLVEPGQVGATS